MRWHDLETLTARLALRPLLTAGDTDWLLDAFFADAGWNFWHMAATMAFIPDDVLVSRLEAEMVSQDVDRRMAVLRMFTQRRNLPAGPEMVRRLAADADPRVRNFAAALLRPLPERAEGSRSEGEPVPPARRSTRERSCMVGAARDMVRRGSV